jgi:hypothetical protein
LRFKVLPGIVAMRSLATSSFHRTVSGSLNGLRPGLPDLSGATCLFAGEQRDADQTDHDAKRADTDAITGFPWAFVHREMRTGRYGHLDAMHADEGYQRHQQTPAERDNPGGACQARQPDVDATYRPITGTTSKKSSASQMFDPLPAVNTSQPSTPLHVPRIK